MHDSKQLFTVDPARQDSVEFMWRSPFYLNSLLNILLFLTFSVVTELEISGNVGGKSRNFTCGREKMLRKVIALHCCREDHAVPLLWCFDSGSIEYKM